LIFISIFGKAVRNASIKKMGVAKKLGGVVEESFSAIKLIVSFAQERREIKKFEKFAQEA
jgi:hypothetical protein